jgi:hypothetical protein
VKIALIVNRFPNLTETFVLNQPSMLTDAGWRCAHLLQGMACAHRPPRRATVEPGGCVRSGPARRQTNGRGLCEPSTSALYDVLARHVPLLHARTYAPPVCMTSRVESGTSALLRQALQGSLDGEVGAVRKSEQIDVDARLCLTAINPAGPRCEREETKAVIDRSNFPRTPPMLLRRIHGVTHLQEVKEG